MQIGLLRPYIDIHYALDHCIATVAHNKARSVNLCDSHCAPARTSCRKSIDPADARFSVLGSWFFVLCS
jgi:hypothetical protein